MLGQKYLRPVGGSIKKIINIFQLIPGNMNTYTPIKSYLEAPFVASKIRFLPYADHPRTSCMRVEIYGCLWKRRYNRNKVPSMLAHPKPLQCDMLWRSKHLLALHALRLKSAKRRCIHVLYVSTEAIVAYSAPVGGHMPTMTNGARFEDLSYDGQIDEKLLTDGLGQLTDSLYGPNDFEIADPADTAGIFSQHK